jgi:hypothetical protein
MDAILGRARDFRGKLAMMTIVTAFVFSIMTIYTNNQCNDPVFKQNSMVSIVKGISIMVLILCILLFGWDLSIKFNLIT